MGEMGCGMGDAVGVGYGMGDTFAARVPVQEPATLMNEGSVCCRLDYR